MKKINASSKFLLFSLSFCICLSITINACKREVLNTTEDIAQIRDFFAKNADLSNQNPFNSMQPNWNDVYVHQEDNQTIYEIGLVNLKKVFEVNENIATDQFDKYQNKNDIRLVIFKNKSNDVITSGCYMSVTKEVQNSAPVHYKKIEDFSGIISFYSLNGNYANGWTYNSGVLINRLSLGTKEEYVAEIGKRNLLETKPGMSTFPKGKLMLKQAIECYSSPVFLHGETCVGVDGYLQCTPYTRVIYAEVCDGGGGDGGYNPNPGNPGHGGGGTGGSNPATDPENTSDTINHVKNECLKIGLAKAMQKDVKNDIKTLMKDNYLGKNDPDIDFYDSPMSAADSNVYAVTRVSNIISLSISITFNSSNLPKTSEEFMVSTVYHEVLHAYLTALFPPNSPNGKILIPEDHMYMATNYINMMATSLRSIYPAMSESDAKGLAWGGLEKTNAYDFLSDNRKSEINDINKKYIGKVSKGKLGKYCN